MRSFYERISSVVGVIIAWFMFSASSWNLSGLKVLKQQDPIIEIRITVLETLILITSTIIHLAWSGIADKYSHRVVFGGSVVFAMLPLLCNADFEHNSKMEYLAIGIQHFVYSCSLTLTIPTSAKLFLSKFKDEWLNLAFSFLKFSEISAKAFIRILVLFVFYEQEHLALYSATVGSTLLVLFWLAITAWRAEWKKPMRVTRIQNVGNLDSHRVVYNVAVCSLFLRFSQEIILHLLKDVQLMDDHSEILSSMSGIFLAVLLSVMIRDVNVIIYTSLLNVFCLGTGCLCLGMALFGLFPKRIFLSLFGAYFTVAEVFLEGSTAALLGEIDGSIGRTVGIVYGFANIGRIIALIAVNLFPNFFLFLVAISVSLLYSYSLYGLRLYVTVEKELFLPSIF